MGTVKVKVREEYLLHPTVAFTPERMNLGVLGLKLWQRPEQPVAQERHRTPLEEKESHRWLEGYQLACEVQQRCPDTLVVNVADREGDLHAWFLDAMRRVPEERAEFIIRAKCNRRLATGTEPRSVWEAMQKARAAGRMTIELTRQPDRPPRPVTLRIAVKRVTFHGVRRPGGRLPPVEVVAVYAKECRPPRSEEPVEWLLLTSLPVADFPSACPVVPWSRCRWEIEVCQTQPIPMTRCPLGLFRQLRSNPRGGFTRANGMEVNRFSRDDDVADQALGDRLTFCTRELVKVMAQSLAKGLGMVHDLLPMKALLPSVRDLPTCLRHLLPLGRALLTPQLPLTQVEPLGLIGGEHPVVLTLDPLLALEPLREWRLERREVLWCGCRPGLMPLRDHVRMAQQLTQRLPDHGIEPISTHALGVALRRAANRQRRMPFALIVERLGFFADAQVPDAHHPQPALAAGDERPQPIPTCSRPVHLARGFSLALQWPRRVVKPLDRDEGWSVAPHPLARRAIASPGLEITPLVCRPLAIRRDDWLPRVVTRLPSRDAIGPDVSDRRRVPDVVLARWCPRVSGVQPFGDLTTAQVFFHHRAREVSYDGSFQGLAHDLRRIAVTFRSIAVALTTVRPRDAFAIPRFR
jgi:hypothetical protein